MGLSYQILTISTVTEGNNYIDIDNVKKNLHLKRKTNIIHACVKYIKKPVTNLQKNSPYLSVILWYGHHMSKRGHYLQYKEKKSFAITSSTNVVSL